MTGKEQKQKDVVTENFDMVKQKDATNSKRIRHLHLTKCWKKLFLGFLLHVH